jgi:hypothetical protein
MEVGWRTVILTVGLVLASAAPGITTSKEASEPVAATTSDGEFLESTQRLDPYRGDMHAHTAFSDGESHPEEAFADAKSVDWLDFWSLTDHANLLTSPVPVNGTCPSSDPTIASDTCYVSPLPDRTEFEEMKHQADRFSGDGFVAHAGFEWSSFVEGHVNVYNTGTWTDAFQTGQAPMTGLYAWLAGNQLADDRYATFNHPGREPLKFDDFAYEPRMDPFFVSLEAFNKDDDYTDTYLEALDEGWHVGAHGVTDGHEDDERIDPDRGHTVALMTELTEPALDRAFAEGHTVAIRGMDQDARLYVDGALMGDTVANPGSTVTVDVTAYDGGENGPTAFDWIELLGPQGWQRTLRLDDVAEGFQHEIVEVDVDELPTTDLDERYITMRAYQDYEQDGDTDPTVMTSAVWLE